MKCSRLLTLSFDPVSIDGKGEARELAVRMLGMAGDLCCFVNVPVGRRDRPTTVNVKCGPTDDIEAVIARILRAAVGT